MTGDQTRDDDLDFTDDFVIDEGPLANPRPLDELFDEPDSPATADTAAAAAGAPPADADDLLFAGPEADAAPPAEQFEGRAPFAAESPSDWTDTGLDLGDEAVPSGIGERRRISLEAATSDFGIPDEFALDAGQELDTEQELEIVGEPGAALDEPAPELEPAGASEVAQEDEDSELVVLEDGAGQFDAVAGTGATPDAAVAAAGEELAEAALELVAAAEGGDGAEARSDLELSAVAPDAEETPQVGWEPLAGADFDAMADVQEVASASDATADPDAVGADEATDEATAEAGAAPVEWAAAVATARPRPRLAAVPPRAARRSMARVAAAAALLVASGVGVAVWAEPEWFHRTEVPTAQLVAEVPRPALAVLVPTPPLPEPRSVAAVGAMPTPGVETPTGNPETGAGEATPPVVAAGTGPGSEAVAPPPVGVPEAAPEPVVAEPAGPVAAPAQTQPTAGGPPNAVAPEGSAAPSPALAWPVAVVTGTPVERHGTVVRFGNELASEALEAEPAPLAQPVDGVLPGARAFAQLRNGNYFIGNVKSSSRDAVTLIYGKGEVTLPRAELVRITALGSQDYDELQKATAGFVRLTNRNRLVGSILAGITDDHVVLETRSNRVILPRSAVGEIVEGDRDIGVRFGTTEEEDAWLRRQAERQLRSGAPNAVPPAPEPRATGR
jgi:hypothetical protein